MRLLAITFAASLGLAQQYASLGKEDIVRMVQQGMPSATVAEVIRTAPRIAFTATQQDRAELEKQGVSRDVTAAMLARTQQGVDLPPFEGKARKAKPVAVTTAAPVVANAPRPAVATPAPNAAPPVVEEIGVYYSRDGQWIPLPPEIVNWKTGGVLKTVATAGIVKGDLNGNLRNGISKTRLARPIDLLIYSPEGTSIEEYQLLKLREHPNSREFRTVTGGILHVSGGAGRDSIEFESEQIARRTWKIHAVVGPGEYGLLPPGAMYSSGPGAQLGKLHTFSVAQ